MRTEEIRKKTEIENGKRRIEYGNDCENANDTNNMHTDIYASEDSLSIEWVLFADSDQQKCIICRDKLNKNMAIMSKPLWLDFLMLNRMYAPHRVRCCKGHL